MSDLDGMDAFNEVLDRLSKAETKLAENQGREIDATNSANVARITARGQAETIARLQRELNESHAEATKMNAAGTALLAVAKKTKDKPPGLSDAIKLGDDAFDDLPF